MRFPTKISLWLTVAVLVLAFGTAARAETHDFDVPAQDAARAIPEFARQANIQILAAGRILKGVRTKVVSGRLDVLAALRLLLRDTGLAASQNAKGVYIIAEMVARSGPDNSPPDIGAGNQSELAGPLGSVEDHQAILENVVVVGTRQETFLQNTPIAISAVNETEIRKTYSRDIRGVADFIPNVVIENVTPFAAASIGIRGTGTGNIISTIDSAIAVVLDDMVLPHVQSQMLDPFDLEQIEVLRGPQGTLFGKNTTGGVILLRSKRPVLDEFSGQLQGTAGNWGTVEARGAVNIPIVERKLAYRGVFTYQNNHGQFKNDKISTIYGTEAQPDTPLGLPVNGDGRNLGGRDVFYSTHKFLVSPSDGYEALLTFEFLRDRSPTRGLVNETPPDGPDLFGVRRAFQFNLIGFPGIQQTCPRADRDCVFSTGVSLRDDGLSMERGHRIDAVGFYLHQKATFESGILTIFGGYRHQKERLPTSFTGEAWPSLFDGMRNLERDTYQGEARFSSTLAGPFQFTVGAAYFVNELDFRSLTYIGFVDVPIDLGGCNIVDPSLTPGNCMIVGPGSNDRPSYSDVLQDGDAYGIYAELYYDISEDIRLTVGGRHSYEKKTFSRRNGLALTPDELQTWTLTDGDTTTRAALGDDRFALAFDDRNSWDGFTVKAVIDYELDESAFLYFSFNQGFKSGSYAETCVSVTSCAPFNEEKADSFEAGYKGDLFDKTLRVNLAAFYTKIRDVVRSQVVPIIDAFGAPGQETQFRNIAGQENYGIELELLWHPTDDLRIVVMASWLDASYTKFVTQVNVVADISGALRPECFNVDAFGNDDAKCLGIVPNFAPEWKLGANVTYTMSLGNAGSLIWYGSVQWQPSYEYSLFNSDFTQAEERTLIDLNLSYLADRERWQLTFFVKNLLNETYRVAANSVAGLWNFSNYGDTRRYGVELSIEF